MTGTEPALSEAKDVLVGVAVLPGLGSGVAGARPARPGALTESLPANGHRYISESSSG